MVQNSGDLNLQKKYRGKTKVYLNYYCAVENPKVDEYDQDL